MAFLVLTEKIIETRVPPITICWGGEADGDSTCGIVTGKFLEGTDLIKQYVPFTAGSFEELKLKVMAFYGQ